MLEEACACVPQLLHVPDADLLYDQHSSEEELEVHGDSYNNTRFLQQL